MKPLEALKRRNEQNRLAQQGTRDALIEEGRNQVLYLLLCIGDQNVAHDNWHPDRAHILFEVRKEILARLRTTPEWPQDWPDFQAYSYTPG